MFTYIDDIFGTIDDLLDLHKLAKSIHAIIKAYLRTYTTETDCLDVNVRNKINF